MEQAYSSRNGSQRNRVWMMYVDRLKIDFATVCKTLINKAVAKYQLQVLLPFLKMILFKILFRLVRFES